MNSLPHSDRIIVGVDGSEYSSNALQVAGRMAEMMKAPLEVISCIEKSNRLVASRFETEPNRFTSQLSESVELLVEQALERAFGTTRPADLSISVSFDEAAESLIEQSRSAQLLVVGRRGSGGFLNHPIGSVSKACAAHAHCPVLVVPQNEPARNTKENTNGK
ncbi:universal stress protein [Arthrobacter sp. CAN_A1]|uniref:universal stress protein n=1 Tax=Arthrobacter sp. CAN_A1 TaxID=2787717 RepID=UPI0018CBD757